MFWSESAYSWLVYSALLSLVVLAVGSAAMLLCRQPTRRLRIIELSLAGCLIAPLLGMIPGYPQLAIGWRHAGTGPFFGEKTLSADKRLTEDMDLSPSAAPSDVVPRLAPELPQKALAEPIEPPARAWNVGSWLVAIYVFGVVAGILWWLVGVVALVRIIWTAQPAPPRCRQLLAEIAGRRGDRVQLLASPRAKQPFASAWWPIFVGVAVKLPPQREVHLLPQRGLWGRAVIVLPANLCDDEQGVRWALAHEWTHIERHDFLAWFAAGLARVLFFYQPLVWWLRRQLRLCQDYVADAQASRQTSQPEDYAEFLTVRAAAGLLHPAMVGLGMGFSKSELYRRVVMLIQNRPLESRPPRLWTVSVTCCALVLVATVAALSLSPQTAGAEQPTDKSGIIAVLKRRQAYFRSGDVTWSENRTKTMYSTTGKNGELPEEHIKNDEIHVDRKRFVFEGEKKMHYDTANQNFGTEGPGQPWQRYISTFNGRENRFYSPPGEPQIGHASGQILGIYRAQEEYRDLRTLSFAAVILACRPLHPVICDLDDAAYTLVPGEAVIDGHRCVVLRETPETEYPGHWNTFWLDRDRDYVIVKLESRYRHFRGKGAGGAGTTVTISYQNDAKHGWVPSGWTTMWLNENTGAIYNVEEATVTKYAFNVDIPPELFDLPFPPGTYVRDLKQNEFWVALPGGRKRVLTEAERKANVSYEELLKMESGAAEVPAGTIEKTRQQSSFSKFDSDAVANGAIETWKNYVAPSNARGKPVGSGEIPPALWAPAIRDLKPEYVYAHGVNIAIVRSCRDGKEEEGIYVALSIASMAGPNAEQFTMTLIARHPAGDVFTFRRNGHLERTRNVGKTTADQVIVEDLALEMLVAIREKKDDALKALAVDRLKDWREALPHFALECRERFTQNTGKSFVMYPVESLVEGDLAVVRCARPKEIPGDVCLVLYFVKTADGWRNWMLRNSPPGKPLSEFLKEKASTQTNVPAR